MIQPLKIKRKTDNDAKIAQIVRENIPATEYMSADEVNAIVGKINEMVPAINVSNGGFQGPLSINEKRVDSGFYIPTESGTYINAGDVVVDLSHGINFVTYDGDKWDVAVVPIVADGKVEEGNAGFVSGGEVFSIDKFNKLGYIIAGGNVSIATLGYNVKLIIPKSSRVVCANYQFLTSEDFIFDGEIKTPMFVFFNTNSKKFDLVSVTERTNYQGCIYLGILNGYKQQQVLNTTLLFVNEVKQEFVKPFVFDNKLIYNSQEVLKMYSFWKNPINTSFNYNCISRLEAVAGDYKLLLEEDGVTPIRMFITFIRVKGFNGSGVSTSIIQIGSMIDGDVGLNKNTILNYSSEIDNTEKSILSIELIGIREAVGLKFSMIMDLSLLSSEIVGSAYLGGTLELDTRLFIEQLKAQQLSNVNNPLSGKVIVCFGDSVTEGSIYTQVIEEITAAKVYNVGFGGCRMGGRTSTSEISLAYNQMAMYEVSKSVATQDFSQMEAAAIYLRDNVQDDNTAIVARLKSIDFNKVDYISIFYGTNDFTSNDEIIGEFDSYDIMTIIGATNVSIDNLLTAYPHLKVLLITPTHRYIDSELTQDSDSYVNSKGLKLIDFCDGIISASNNNHIASIDLYRHSGLNKYNHSLYFKDGVHPNTLGGRYLGRLISNKILNI